MLAGPSGGPGLSGSPTPGQVWGWVRVTGLGWVQGQVWGWAGHGAGGLLRRGCCRSGPCTCPPASQIPLMAQPAVWEFPGTLSPALVFVAGREAAWPFHRWQRVDGGCWPVSVGQPLCPLGSPVGLGAGGDSLLAAPGDWQVRQPSHLCVCAAG